MNVLMAFTEGLGRRFIGWTTSVRALAQFLYHVLSAFLAPATWNRATLDNVIRQVYFTAVQALNVFLPYTLVIIGVIVAIIVSTARGLGLSYLATDLVIRVLTLELLPFLTALFVALRSGSAINTEVALMEVTRELDAFRHCGVNPLYFEFLPRVAGGVISVLSLSLLAGFISLAGAYLGLYGLSPAGASYFSMTVANVFSIPTMLGWFVKCVLFGLVVTSVPIAAGLETPPKTFFVPISVLRGMMRVFFALVLIEVLSLAAKYV